MTHFHLELDEKYLVWKTDLRNMYNFYNKRAHYYPCVTMLIHYSCVKGVMYFTSNPLLKIKDSTSVPNFNTQLLWVCRVLSRWALDTHSADWDKEVCGLTVYTVCACVCLVWAEEKLKRKRDVWLETTLSIRLRVFVIVSKEERRRRNNAALSGKMCFLVTMAFLVHNLSLFALWGMCLSLPPTDRGQNQSWLIAGLAFTVSFTYVSSVYLSHRRGQTHSHTAQKKKMKKRRSTDRCLTDHRSGLVEHYERERRFVFWMHQSFEWLPFVLKCYEPLTRKSTVPLLIHAIVEISLFHPLICPCSLLIPLFSPAPLSNWHPNEGAIMHEAGRGGSFPCLIIQY